MIQTELTNGALTDEQIVKYVTEHKTKVFRDNLRYYTGDNPAIRDRVIPVVNAPKHQLPVSYARKIVKTVVGYMYKPGLITYNVDDQTYSDALDIVWRMNNENTKTSAMGRQASIQGVGYELHYTAGGANPYFAKVPAANIIDVYDYAIEPELIAAIWHRRQVDEGESVDVFYADRVERYLLLDRATGGNRLEFLGDEPHEYEEVPLVVFENNEEHLGDFEPVKSLIDAYDLLLSDSMNEFDRFAWAYLILKNVAMSDQDSKEVKHRKIIELLDDGEARFLQKDIPSDYIRFMSEWIRKEIHKQTHVPDFTDTTMGTEMTGAAIDRLFYDFEFIAADKEDRFRDALKDRIRLVNVILRKGTRVSIPEGIEDDVEIVMDRNKPEMLSELGQTALLYRGFVTDKTLLKNFAPFVKDVEEELQAREEERSPYRSPIDANQEPGREQEADREEDQQA